MTRNVRWWHRLGARLSALIAVVTLATVGTLAFVCIRGHQRQMIAEKVRGAGLLGETIKSSIYRHMLDDRRQDAYLIMDAIGAQEGIDAVRMFNTEGKVAFSTDRSEIGGPPKGAFSCTACHEGSPLARPDVVPPHHSIFPDAKGGRTLALVTPVYNEAACSSAACHAHPSSQRVLGVLEVGLDLAVIDAALAGATRRSAGLASLAIAILIGLVVLFVRAFVVRPVHDLLGGVHRVTGNDLEHEIPIRSEDELGALAREFNAMTGSLREVRAELRGLMTSLEAQVEERTAALLQAQDQLVQSEKMSSLGKLSASIAHEINNPLMGILTTSKLLLRVLGEEQGEDPVRPECLRQLRLVQRETERCSAIVRNLLDFSRQRPLALKSIDANLALEEALSVASNQIALQGIALDKRLAPIPAVHADLGQLRQALLNIVLNACEAMPRGGALTVATRLLEAEGRVQVEVADSGPGIAPEDLNRICDPFFTTKERGTGLGLSVVYGIVQRHGGKLGFSSVPGGGTRVLLEVRVAPQAPTGAPGEGR